MAGVTASGRETGKKPVDQQAHHLLQRVLSVRKSLMMKR